MGKYDGLADYLNAQRRDEVPMKFEQIERLIGAKLPASHRYRAWWSNNSFNSVMTKAWLEAGFRSEQVDMEGRKLVFRRIGLQGFKEQGFKEQGFKEQGFKEQGFKEAHSAGRSGRVEASERHPLIGWMKGTVRIAPGVDLTEPADPEWGDRAWGDQK
jgi:hypothetical protein